MAHWIIEDTKNGIRNYMCSNCEHIYYNQLLDPLDWTFCPECFSPINEPYESIKKENEVTAVEPTPMKDVVILSIEKYDKMKSDLVKLGEDLEVANRDKDRALNLIKYIGLNEEFAKKIIPGTGKFIEEEVSPITLNRKIYCCFEIERE